jgi:branched-subunit amino acid ABC-type transport system permease component
MLFTTDVLSLRNGPLPTVTIGDVSITALHLSVLGVVLVTFPALQIFLTRSRVGTAIRALADNPFLSEVQGSTLIFSIQ